MRETKEEKGITLVALIITIIVLLILAAVAIRAVQDGGIIQHAQNARNEYIIGEEKEKEVLRNYLTYLEENASETPYIVHNDTIPLGAKYIIKDGATLESTENNYAKFPETVKDSDIYIYGDYEYRYNEYYHGGNTSWTTASDQNGWGVRVKDNDVTKTAYGSIVTTINGKNVTNMCSTFYACDVMEVAPAIPKTVTNLWAAFHKCETISTAPKIPDGVVNMERTFASCKKLTKTPYIPNTVNNMISTFAKCSNIVSVTNFPNSVENLETTFWQCTSLKSIPEIPNSVKKMGKAFYGCTNLEGTIKINVENDTTCTGCFENTEKVIFLIGNDAGTNTDFLTKLINTANNGNVKLEIDKDK